MRQRPAVIVLAAGQGTRMKSALPKVLHPVAGRPMIGHVVAEARRLAGAKGRIMVVTAPSHDAVREMVTPSRSCIQKVARGTGDAVRVALKALGRMPGPVVIAYGDMPLVTAGVLKRVVSALPKKGDGLAVLGFHIMGEHAYGRLVLDDTGALQRIVEARDATREERAITLCNSGLMAASSGDLLARLLARLSTDNAKGEYYLTDAVAIARADGLACAVVEGPGDALIGVNSRVELARAEALMQDRLRHAAMMGGATLQDPATTYLSFDTRLGRDVTVGPNVWFGPGVTVGDGTDIRPNCHFEGARVGKGAIVGPFARLRPGAKIADGAHIGNYVEIKEATVGKGAKINHLTYVGDATVGAGANLGAGTVTCNYDGYGKYRTRIGRGTFIGSDVALVAPVTVGDGVVIGAGSVVTKNVPKDALVIARGTQKNIAQGGARYRARKQAEQKRKNKKKA